MLDILRWCIQRNAGAVRITDNAGDGTQYSEAEAVHNRCIFCHATEQNGFRIVWENDTYKVFYDYRPAAAYHLQVIPKRHIDSVKSLVMSDVTMLQEMEELGHRILDEMGVPRSLQRLGFHIPPFTSVKHLHLHVQGLPYTSRFYRIVFPVVYGSSGREKGFGWFVEIGQTRIILAKGSRVGILPC